MDGTCGLLVLLLRAGPTRLLGKVEAGPALCPLVAAVSSSGQALELTSLGRMPSAHLGVVGRPASQGVGLPLSGSVPREGLSRLGQGGRGGRRKRCSVGRASGRDSRAQPTWPSSVHPQALRGQVQRLHGEDRPHRVCDAGAGVRVPPGLLLLLRV